MTWLIIRRAVTVALLALPAAVVRAQMPEGEEPDAPDAAWADAGITAPWTGDLDGMVERRAIRFLVVPSKTSFFLDRGQQLGLTHDLAREFEAQLNKTLKLKTRKLVVYFIPTSRDRLLDDLLEGKGDVAAANLTITPERAARVSFSEPLYANARELVCAHAGTTLPATPEDLAGRDVMVRESSSYHESLRALNERLVAAGRPPVTIVPAHPLLEDEDILEMVNAGIVELTVVDEHKAQLWVQIFPEVRMLETVSLRDEGRIAWAMRPDSPQLKEAVDRFVKTAAKGTKLGNMLIKKYLGTTRWIANAAAEQDRARFVQMVRCSGAMPISTASTT
jgi:membrane-bound lytic murein transglycosylase MltF